MQELGMVGGRFECGIESVAGDPRPIGNDEVDFQVTANPGMPLRSLRKVASGGELARISLAIKVATIALDDTPVLVFDEVDSGIGGAVAEIVGRKLRQLGHRRQVLCVTHLPQVAACAHHHYRVSKIKSEDRTESQVDNLDNQHRVDELARMLGGVEITAPTRAAAADLLKRLSA
jgi:DNA repair protein RecN (Recombination protein N)